MLRSIVIWLTILGAGAVFFASLRHYARAERTESRALNLVEKSGLALEDGRYQEAQRHLLSAVGQEPRTALESAMESLSLDLLYLPQAQETLAITEQEAPFKPGDGHLEYLALFQMPLEVAKALDACEDRPSLIWLARQGLMSGALEQARVNFKAYWESAEESAAELRDALSKRYEADPEDFVSALMWSGVWAAPGPKLDAYDFDGIAGNLLEAIQADLEGRNEAAYKAYLQVQNPRPNHWFAIRRLHALMGHRESGSATPE